jgi:hypothetical protein
MLSRRLQWWHFGTICAIGWSARHAGLQLAFHLVILARKLPVKLFEIMDIFCVFNFRRDSIPFVDDSLCKKVFSHVCSGRFLSHI